VGVHEARNYLCLNDGRKVKMEGCEAQRIVSLHRADMGAELDASPIPGQLPPVVMTRTLLNRQADPRLDCAQPSRLFSAGAETQDGFFVCSDTWVVKLTHK